MAKLRAEMDNEAASLRLSNKERALQEDLLSKVDRLRQAGITLSPIETSQLDASIRKLAELREQAQLFDSVMERAMKGAEDAFMSFINTGKVDFRAMITSMIADVARLAAQQFLIKPLGDMLSGLMKGSFVGGGAGGGFGSSLLKGAMSFLGGGRSFATGGSFTVGGSGGVDSQLVQLRASPGERVTVQRPNQSNGGERTQIVFNIQTPNVQSFRESESQIAARMARLASKGQRNM